MSGSGPAHWQCLRADDGPITLPQGSLVLRPIPRDLARCQKHLQAGQLVQLEAVDAAQMGRDKSYHCQLREAFINLREVPETGVQDYNEFRRFLLIKRGYYADRVHVFETPEIAESVRPIISENANGLSMIIRDGCNLIVRRALSQKIGRGAEMTVEQRYHSYDDTLDEAAALLEITRHDLAIASERNA